VTIYMCLKLSCVKVRQVKLKQSLYRPGQTLRVPGGLDSQISRQSAHYRMVKKDGLNFVRLYFLNYTWYVNDLHNI